MKFFHAHIYYDLPQSEKIKELKSKAELAKLKVWKLFEQQVGPHDKPMLEIHFTDANQDQALNWLRAHHGEFSVLIHEDTGDDFNDHEQAQWLGSPLPLHFEFFTQVKNDPTHAVHKTSKKS